MCFCYLFINCLFYLEVATASKSRARPSQPRCDDVILDGCLPRKTEATTGSFVNALLEEEKSERVREAAKGARRRLQVIVPALRRSRAHRNGRRHQRTKRRRPNGPHRLRHAGPRASPGRKRAPFNVTFETPPQPGAAAPLRIVLLPSHNRDDRERKNEWAELDGTLDSGGRKRIKSPRKGKK